ITIRLNTLIALPRLMSMFDGSRSKWKCVFTTSNAAGMKITPPDAINPCCKPERCKIAAPAQNFANGVAAMAAARGVGLAVGAAAIANPSINDPRDDGAADETDC